MTAAEDPDGEDPDNALLAELRRIASLADPVPSSARPRCPDRPSSRSGPPERRSPPAA